MKIMDYQVLECPDCGEEYLHQVGVEVWFRGEDATSGLHARLNGTGLSADGEMRGDPSPRRQGFIIRFYCEHCSNDGKYFYLSIIQHKGQTHLERVARALKDHPEKGES